MKWYREIIFLFIFSFCLSKYPEAQQKGFSIRIVQEDAVHHPEPGTSAITLQQKTFKIQVLLQHLEGVYVFASFQDSLYNLPGPDPVPGFTTLTDLVMAEEAFNKDKELLVADDGWSYWFFDPSLDWHRFNKKMVLLDSGRVVGTKTIKQLYLVAAQESVKLKENNKPLYLFFVAAEKADANGKPMQELYRRRIKIDWRDED